VEQTELSAELKSFIGTTRYYRHWLGVLVYTDGVKFLADRAKAYWLIDSIVFAQSRALRDAALREFQLWELFVTNEGSASLVCSRDSEDEAFRIEIPATDFPLRYVKLYLEGHVLLLPSEH
jgi:hypothetical protein